MGREMGSPERDPCEGKARYGIKQGLSPEPVSCERSDTETDQK